LIVHAHSVKNTDTAAHKGYDAGKTIGDQAPYCCGPQGLPHAVAVTTAEVTDRKGMLQTLNRCKPTLRRVQSLLAASAYVRDTLSEEVTVQIAKRSELHAFKVMPQRWVVQRSFVWLQKNRRLWKNCERRLNTSLQFVHLAFVTLLQSLTAGVRPYWAHKKAGARVAPAA
jgi:transposase